MPKRGIGLVLDLPSPEELRKGRFRKPPPKAEDMADEGAAEQGDAEDGSPSEEHSLMKEFFEAGNDGDWEAACGFLREYVNKYA